MTFAPAPGSAAFLAQIRRRQPLLYRGLLDEATCRAFDSGDSGRFDAWCQPPAVARLYVRTEERAPGTARACAIDDVAEAPAIDRHFRARGETLTLLINRADAVDPDLRRLRSSFGIPFSWREDDIVATWSTPGSGIGFHAGHEDGFIVQVKGRRRWNLWPESALPAAYRRMLFGHRSCADVAAPPRPTDPPTFSCELAPGDALFVPSLTAHEGITLRESISLSIAWRGIRPLEILEALPAALSRTWSRALDTHPDVFFTLLPDPPDAAADPVEFLATQMATRLRPLGPPHFDVEMLARSVRRVLTNAAQ